LKAGEGAQLEIDNDWPPVLRWVGHIVARERRAHLSLPMLSLPDFG
jgi:hypothetical protein